MKFIRNIAAVLGIVLSLQAETLLDFGEISPDQLRVDSEKQQSCRRETVDAHSCLLVSWNCAKAPWCTVNLKKAVVLPTFSKAVFTLQVRRKIADGVKCVSLFFADCDGEIFQLVKTLPPCTQGGAWQKLTYDLDVLNFKGNIWGGNLKNRSIDFPLRFTGISCSFSRQDGVSSIQLGALDFTSDTPEKQQKTIFSIECGNDLPILRSGKENNLALKVNSSDDSTIAKIVEYRVSDVNGKIVEHNKKTVKLNGGTGKIPLNIPVRRGIYYIHASDTPSCNLDSVRPLSFAYLEPTGPAPRNEKDFIFGICTHPQRYDASEQKIMARYAALCGAQVMRVTLESQRLQRRKDQWTFGEYDQIFDVFEANQLEIAPIFLGMPSWAVAGDYVQAIKVDSPRGKLPDLNLWREYVRKITRHYKDRLRMVEIWNEPDLIGFANFPPEEYVKLQKVAFEEIRKIKPEIKIISAGFATPDMNPPGLTADRNFVEKSIRQARGFYDIFAIHIHTMPARYQQIVNAMIEMRNRLGDRTAWYSNETAIAAHGDITEKIQAETLFKKLIYAWSRGAIGYNWYNLRNLNRHDSEGAYGLITYDLQPKAAYVAYNTLTSFFRGARFEKTEDYGDNCFYYFTAVDGTSLIVCWRSPFKKYSADSLLMIAGLKSGKQIDLWGNETPLEVRDGNCFLRYDGEISILKFDQTDSRPTIQGEFLKLPGELRTFPGRTQILNYRCVNPTGKSIKAKLNFLPLPGVTINPNMVSAEILPHQSHDFRISVKTDAAFSGGMLNVGVTIPELWSGELSHRLQKARLIPTDGIYSKEPEFVLDNSSQLQMLFPVEGSYAHLQWKGKEDLSARVYLVAADRTLKLKVAVTDDIHCQKEQGSAVWKYDNVQFGLSMPRQKGLWIIGLTHLENGKSEVFIWNSPKGFRRESTVSAIRLQTSRDESEKLTIYEAEIPFRSIGMTEEMGSEGIGFNLMVNDNDGGGRESFISAAPGLSSQDSSRFLTLFVERSK